MLLTEWYPPSTVPLRDRIGEYETHSQGHCQRRWWDGRAWSRAYDLDDSSASIAKATKTRSSDKVTWRGIRHRFVPLQQVRYGRARCTVMQIKFKEDHWLYLLSSTNWISLRWVQESILRHDERRLNVPLVRRQAPSAASPLNIRSD